MRTVVRSLGLSSLLIACASPQRTVEPVAPVPQPVARAPEPPPAQRERQVRQLVASQNDACVLRADGRVLCTDAAEWAKDSEVPAAERAATIEIPGLAGAQSLASSPITLCAAMRDGSVQCVGSDVYSMLGRDEAKEYWRPVTIPGVTDARGIAISGGWGCAVRADGTVQCWGSTGFGTPAAGAASTGPLPTVPGLASIESIGVGGGHACALAHDGAVFCWGQNDQGQLGDGTTTDRGTPARVALPARATRVAAYEEQSCVLLEDGSVWCWGDNQFGATGSAQSGARTRPERVEGLERAVEVMVGSSYACARTEAGPTYCWGIDEASQKADADAAGVCTSAECLHTPRVQDAIAPGALVALSNAFTCVAGEDDAVQCWRGARGQTFAVPFDHAPPACVGSALAQGVVIELQLDPAGAFVEHCLCTDNHTRIQPGGCGCFHTEFASGAVTPVAPQLVGRPDPRTDPPRFGLRFDAESVRVCATGGDDCRAVPLRGLGPLTNSTTSERHTPEALVSGDGTRLVVLRDRAARPDAEPTTGIEVYDVASGRRRKRLTLTFPRQGDWPASRNVAWAEMLGNSLLAYNCAGYSCREQLIDTGTGRVLRQTSINLFEGQALHVADNTWALFDGNGAQMEWLDAVTGSAPRPPLALAGQYTGVGTIAFRTGASDLLVFYGGGPDTPIAGKVDRINLATGERRSFDPPHCPPTANADTNASP